MAYCCDDPDILFTDDYEDGSYPAKYKTVVGGITVTAGSGINGSHGLVSADDFDEVFPKFPIIPTDDPTLEGHLDQCGKGRRAFGMGAYVTPVSDTSEFHIFELLDDDPFSGPVISSIFSIEKSLRDLVLHIGGTLPDPEIYRIHNAFSAGTRVKIEARGNISSFNEELGDSEADGSIEIRINGRVYNNGDEFPAIDPSEPPDPCTVPITGIKFALSTFGWNAFSFAPLGAGDCLYVSENGNYCNEHVPETKTRPCDPPGPGGAPPGPIIVHPGGYPVGPGDYVAPSGGGVPSTASDPSVPQSLVGIATPLISFDLTLVDATVKRYSQVDGLPAVGRASAEGRIVRIEPIEYALSDRFGSIRAQTWSVSLADPDGGVRALLESATNRFYKRWQGQLFGESDPARVAGTARLSLARGRVLNVNTDAPQVVTLTISDELSHPNSPYSLERIIPHVLIGDVISTAATATGIVFTNTGLPPDLANHVMPLRYGEASDERKLIENPPAVPLGICPVYFVGSVGLKNGSETWHMYIVSLYACKAIKALFGSNLNPECPGSVRLDPELFSSMFLVPGLGNWSSYFATNYHDITNGGSTYRVTAIFGRGPISQAHVDGKVPISINVWGKEDVGDSSGTLIDDGAYILQEFLQHPVLVRALIGNEAAPTFADGVAKIRTSSFLAVKTIHDARITGGYKEALIIDEGRAARDWIADILVSSNSRLLNGNTQGQLVLTTFDDTQSLTGLPLYTDVAHVRGDTFRTTSERAAELENELNGDYGPEPATGRVTGQFRKFQSATSVTNWGNGEPFKGADRHYLMAYTSLVAADLNNRELLKTQDGITRGEWASDLDLLALKPGDLFLLTDFRGLGTTGWTQRVLFIESLVANYNLSLPIADEDLGVTVKWEDVQPILLFLGYTPGTVGASNLGFHPMGDNGVGVAPATSGGGWSMGISYRMG